MIPHQHHGLTAVSRKAYDIITQLESRAMSVEVATTTEAIDARIDELTVTRVALYSYIAELERQAGIHRTVKLRF